MLEKLKQLNLDRLLDTDEAVALSAYARTLEAEYEALALDEPEWLVKATATLREEIARRTKAADLAKLREIEAELEGYKSVSERKTEAQRRLAEIQRKLGMVPAGRK